MSRFLSAEAAVLSPYAPGEQPRERQYVKLNTNESPYPPSPKVAEALSPRELDRLNLYSDPACAALRQTAADRFGLRPEQVLCGNGSDELLAFAFRAFCGRGRGAAFADVTYGFYPVWARLFGLETAVVPLREDFSLCPADYAPLPHTVFIANPNAPTGMALGREALRPLLAADPARVVVVDEAYVDFGAESCLPLLAEYENLLVIQTFSKSRSLAGARLGLALGGEALISDLDRVRYSFHPYNVNRLTQLAGAAALEDVAYLRRCTQAIGETRAETVRQLEDRGFFVLPSQANFVFARRAGLAGDELYRRLKEKGVLVRHFAAPARTRDFCRITIGSPAQMAALLAAVDELWKELGL